MGWGRDDWDDLAQTWREGEQSNEGLNERKELMSIGRNAVLRYPPIRGDDVWASPLVSICNL